MAPKRRERRVCEDTAHAKVGRRVCLRSIEYRGECQVGRGGWSGSRVWVTTHLWGKSEDLGIRLQKKT